MRAVFHNDNDMCTFSRAEIDTNHVSGVDVALRLNVSSGCGWTLTDPSAVTSLHVCAITDHSRSTVMHHWAASTCNKSFVALLTKVSRFQTGRKSHRASTKICHSFFDGKKGAHQRQQAARHHMSSVSFHCQLVEGVQSI